MTDSMLLLVRKGDILIDGHGHEWLATCDAFQPNDANHCRVVVRRGPLVRHLNRNDTGDWRLK